MNLTPYHAKFFAYDILRKSRNDIASVVFNAKVEFNPHQIMAAQFALKSPINKGVLLADEVGLGKTIEAGLILAQMWAERKRKLIIVCPAVLRKQWAEELKDKFALDVKILDNKQINDKLHHSTSHKIFICSYNLLNRDFAQHELQKISFDLVVFDEAHKLRNEKSTTYKSCFNLFKSVKKILLTATPLQNSLRELYGLVNIIDDKVFSSDRVLSGKLSDTDLTQLKNRLKPIYMRTLRKDVESFIKYTKRYSETFNYQSTTFERQLYHSLDTFINDKLDVFYDPRVIHLVRVALLKIKSSSSIAIYQTLLKIKHRIEISGMTQNKINDTAELDNEIIQESIEEYDDEGTDLENDELNKITNDNQLSAVELQLIKDEALKELANIMRDLKILIDNNQDSKLPNLDKAIKFGILRMREIKAADKCVIFTESLITQTYLYQYLEAHGFENKVVLFNSHNSDEKSKAIYQHWRSLKANRNKISDVKSADMKLAIINYFEKYAQIMIATDSASEGVNLQFCSLLINFDLPWNPQRIEQRIGRIHRYGQKHDVVIINFLDTNNQIDKHIFDILDKKIGLFNGMFGASNEILGQITNLNTGFEKQIYHILQNCRTEIEITREFDLLNQEFQEENNQRIERAKEVLQEFDEDVHKLLQTLQNDNTNRLDAISQRFWDLTKYQLPKLAPKVKFNELEKTIELQQKIATITPTTYYLIKKDSFDEQKDYTQNQLYKLNHPLGELVIQAAKNEATPIGLLEFDLSNYKSKVSALEVYKNIYGTLALEHLTIVTNGYQEDFLAFSGELATGDTLIPEECERLFKLEAVVKPKYSVALQNLEQLQIKNRNEACAKYQQYKANNYQDEFDKIEYFREDLLGDYQVQINLMDLKIKEANKLMGQSDNLTAKWEYTSQINDLRTKKRAMEQGKQHKELELDVELTKLMQSYGQELEPTITHNNLFIVQFKIV